MADWLFVGTEVPCFLPPENIIVYAPHVPNIHRSMQTLHLERFKVFSDIQAVLSTRIFHENLAGSFANPAIRAGSSLDLISLIHSAAAHPFVTRISRLGPADDFSRTRSTLKQPPLGRYAAGEVLRTALGFPLVKTAKRYGALVKQSAPRAPLPRPRQFTAISSQQIVTHRIFKTKCRTRFTLPLTQPSNRALCRQGRCQRGMELPIAFRSAPPRQRLTLRSHYRVSPVRPVIHHSPTRPAPDQSHPREKPTRLADFPEITDARPVPSPPVNPQNRPLRRVQ